MKQFYDQALQQALMGESDSNNAKAVVKTFHETVRWWWLCWRINNGGQEDGWEKQSLKQMMLHGGLSLSSLLFLHVKKQSCALFNILSVTWCWEVWTKLIKLPSIYLSTPDLSKIQWKKNVALSIILILGPFSRQQNLWRELVSLSSGISMPDLSGTTVESSCIAWKEKS